MDRPLLERYLNVGGGACIVDVREVEDAPGNVRTVTIHRGNRVTIEYDKAKAYLEGDYEGGGLKYVAQYANLDDLLADLEDFLATRIDGWSNFTTSRFPVTTIEDPDPAKSLRYFEDLVREAVVPLPKNGKYEVAGVYWRHIAKYGEYREDLLLAEQDEEIRRSET